MPSDIVDADVYEDSDVDDDDENDMNYEINGLTDVEDLEDDTKRFSGKRSPVPLPRSPKPRSNDEYLTDVEDYNLSGAEDSDDEIPFPEPMVSLQEFLDQGQSEEGIDHGNGLRVRTGIKSKKGKFGIRPDCVESDNNDTESEDRDVSMCDPEDILSTAGDLDDFLPELNNDDFRDQLKDSDDEISEDDVVSVSVASDVGECAWGGVSDVEDLLGSDREEVFQAESDSDYSVSEVESPPLELGFAAMIRKFPRKTQDYNLTDVEGLDSDTGSDSDIPVAMVLRSRGSLTDVEPMGFIDIEEVRPRSVSESYLPQTVREMVIVKPNKRGDDITNVLPLEGDLSYQGLCCESSGNVTDEENYSDVEEKLSDAGSVNCEFLNCIESDVVRNSEIVKSPKSPIKKEFMYEGQVTDTEELFMDGPSEKRRPKAKVKRSKVSELKASQFNETVTDVEDFDFGGLSLNPPPTIEKDPFKTDVEYVTGEESSDSKAEVAEVYLKLDSYCSSISTIDSISPSKNQKPLSVSCTYNKPHFLRRDDLYSQHLTDVEDFQLPSDCEDAKPMQFIPIDTQSFVGDASTVIKDMDVQPFDIEKEKMHIKGMNPNECITDVESVDEEVVLKQGFHSMRM